MAPLLMEVAVTVLESLDRRCDLTTLIRAFPVVFLIHDVEEVLTAEQFLRDNRGRLPIPAILSRRMEVTTRQFAAAVAYLMAIISGVSYSAGRSLKPGAAMNLFATAMSGIFLNAFTHLGQALLLRRYTPGVVSAVTVALPYSLYTLGRLRRENLVNQHDLSRAMRAGALLMVPLALSAHAVGKLATRRR